MRVISSGVIERIVLSFMPAGSLATLSYSRKLLTPIQTLLAASVALPIYVQMSRSRAEDHQLRAGTLTRGIQVDLFLFIPITVLVIFLILYTMFRSFKWAMLILVSVMMASIGGPLALFITRTNFSVSSAVGFLALFGVSVQTGVIMLEYINQLRARRKGMEVSTQEHIIEAAVEGAVLRLRPIMMTMLVATLGLLPAALSHAIGSDSQRPFAIVIVGGLLANLAIGIFLLPTLYVWMARENDVLPVVESTEEF